MAGKGTPDETTVCKFRDLLEAHDLRERLFEEIGRHLQAKGLKVSTGPIADATIINAPSSTKNRDGRCVPEMHQTKKGNQWYFGMKAHFGVDSKTKLIHSVVATSANVHDKHPLPQLLHGHVRDLWKLGLRQPEGIHRPGRAQGQGLHQPESIPAQTALRMGVEEEPDQVASAC